MGELMKMLKKKKKLKKQCRNEVKGGEMRKVDLKMKG